MISEAVPFDARSDERRREYEVAESNGRKEYFVERPHVDDPFGVVQTLAYCARRRNTSAETGGYEVVRRLRGGRFFLYMIAFNKGCERISASTSSVIIATVPVMTALLAGAIFRETLRSIRWFPIAVKFSDRRFGRGSRPGPRGGSRGSPGVSAREERRIGGGTLGVGTRLSVRAAWRIGEAHGGANPGLRLRGRAEDAARRAAITDGGSKQGRGCVQVSPSVALLQSAKSASLLESDSRSPRSRALSVPGLSVVWRLLRAAVREEGAHTPEWRGQGASL